MAINSKSKIDLQILLYVIKKRCYKSIFQGPMIILQTFNFTIIILSVNLLLIPSSFCCTLCSLLLSPFSLTSNNKHIILNVESVRKCSCIKRKRTPICSASSSCAFCTQNGASAYARFGARKINRSKCTGHNWEGKFYRIHFPRSCIARVIENVNRIQRAMESRGSAEGAAARDGDP